MNNRQNFRLNSINDIGKLISSNNQVLVETVTKNEEKKTASGIWLVTDTDWRPAMHTNRQSKVIKLPDSLYYNNTPRQKLPSDAPESLPWDTDMELKVGDMVWHDFMAVHNCPVITTEDEPDKEYKLIRYDDIYVAKRGEKIIVLNGYVLCEEVFDKTSALDVENKRPSFIKGKVRYMGKPNREYLSKKKSDAFADFGVGDVIVKRRITKQEGADDRIFLEDAMHKTFSDKMFFIIQRCDVFGKIIDPDEVSDSNNS